MALIILVALLICAFNLGALITENSTRQFLGRPPKFWFQALVFISTVFLVGVLFYIQQTAQQITRDRLGSELQNIFNEQQSEFGKQAQKQETALKQLELSLRHAKSLGEKQEEQTQALEHQREGLRALIISQSGEIELLNRIPLNRNLLGVEISYTPSPEKWSRIAAAYSRIESPEPDLPYAKAPMIAESDGEHWKIDFEPTEISGGIIQTPMGPRPRGGHKKLHKLSTRDNRLFEKVLREALLGLRIVWGNGSETVLDPEQDYYPSAMYVSRNKIKFILRPPLVLWNLNELYENAVVTFYGQDYPIDLPENFTIRSRDPGVVLEQTIQLNWSKRPSSNRPSYDQQVNRKISGPHSLIVKFDVFDPVSGRRYLRPTNKTK